MSTEVASKPRHTIALTRGAAYLLEGILQHKDLPASTNTKLERICKLRRKIRAENPAKHGDHQFEKQIVRRSDETDIDVATRTVAANEAFAAWQDETADFVLSDKQRDTARTSIEWGLKNRDKGVLPQNNDHLLSLLVGFSMGDEEEE